MGSTLFIHNGYTTLGGQVGLDQMQYGGGVTPLIQDDFSVLCFMAEQVVGWTLLLQYCNEH
jgi:hypothetical protein